MWIIRLNFQYREQSLHRVSPSFHRTLQYFFFSLSMYWKLFLVLLKMAPDSGKILWNRSIFYQKIAHGSHDLIPRYRGSGNFKWMSTFSNSIWHTVTLCNILVDFIFQGINILYREIKSTEISTTHMLTFSWILHKGYLYPLWNIQEKVSMLAVLI